MVLGVASSGLHSNGYSLVRKVVFDLAGLGVHDQVPELGQTVGEALPRRRPASTPAPSAASCSITR